MVMANNDRISKALDLLRDGLRPACEQTWQGFYGDDWLNHINGLLHHPDKQPNTDDIAYLLKCIKVTWNEVFGHGLPAATRSLIFELADVRNTWAHKGTFSSDDTVRALDSMERVLREFGDADQRNALKSLRRDLMRQMFDEESRSERRRTAAKPTEGQPQAGLTPWRKIITPHADVASGRFDQAEFAADLFEVASGDADPEYQDPEAFFARTYLTEGLSELLVESARRLSGGGGDPVRELQTNFGGGKTHSMIALYHLASGVQAADLPGVGEVLAAAGVELPAKIKRAVIVGQMTSVSAPERVEENVVLHTLWGRLAYQLGGRDGYELVRADDEAGTNPGAALKALFEQCGPAVVLIDEWVAYARQLRDGGAGERLAGGDFDTQFTFAQALTEAAAAVPNIVLLISIPASDIEVGGERGRAALEKLKNVVTRKAAQWQPASPDESFEIVRRRLFDPIPADKAKVRDGVIRAFAEMYRANDREFPSGITEAEYRRRMELSYPIHPELFDRLFTDWSTLDKFQRTRGVLRFMALAISQLWQRLDQSLLIMPGNLPMDSGALVSEMKKYLDEGWDPVIKSDVDGENALPIRIDKDNQHFGRISATRRAARTVYMGSAPRPDGSRGVDIKSVVLGCAQPGEPIGQFADALKKLSGRATHLYVDNAQYWYSLQPNVTRMAADRAASNYSDADADQEIRRRLLAAGDRGAFAAVHVFPDGPGDVPDDDDGVRLVILAPQAIHIAKTGDSPAIGEAGQLLSQHRAGPRLHRNLLVFLAAAGPRLDELRHEAKSWLAWTSIVEETDQLDLTPSQQAQARSKLSESHDTVKARIEETFIHILTPQTAPGQADIEWKETKPSGSGTLAERVTRKLKSEEKLITAYGGVRVRMDLDRVPLWKHTGDITVGDLWGAYANHPYLPRLASFDVLADAISNGTANMNWENETFAYADAKDGDDWKGIASGGHVAPSRSGFLLRPDVVPAPEPSESPASDGEDHPGESAGAEGPPSPPDRPNPNGPKPGEPSTRFYAKFELDQVRGIRQLEEILANVTNHLGANVKLTLEVEAEAADGFDDRTRRTVKENAAQLGAASAEFER